MQVILVGGSRLLRGGLKVALEESGVEIAGEYGSTEEVPPGDPGAAHVVYLLMHSPGPYSIRQKIEELRRADADSRITVMLSSFGVSDLVEAFAAGGDGLVLEEIEAQALHDSLSLVALGGKVFPSQVATLLSNTYEAQSTVPDSPLTERELEIVRRLALGRSNKEVANELNLALATVKVHVKSALKKLGVSNRTQAAIWALNAGLVSPPQVTVVDGAQQNGSALRNTTASTSSRGCSNGGGSVRSHTAWPVPAVESRQAERSSNIPDSKRSSGSQRPIDETG